MFERRTAGLENTKKDCRSSPVIKGEEQITDKQ